MEIGMTCLKITGREAGEKVAVVDVIDKNFVIIAGPNVRRRRCNLRHLKPLEKLLDIKQGASDGEVNKALRAAFPEETKPAPKVEVVAPKVEKPKEKPTILKKEKIPLKEKKVPKEKKEKVAKAPKKKAKKESK